MEIIQADSISYMSQMMRRGESVDLVLADPPYGNHTLINDAIYIAEQMCTGPMYFFMYAEDLVHLEDEPDQVLHWIKPVSIKNTIKRYSRFVEAIAVYNLSGLNQDMHWSNRTGIFTDHLMEVPSHPFGKPPSLIERILRNHWPTHVLDPFAGSGTVGKVCDRLGIRSTNIEINAIR